MKLDQCLDKRQSHPIAFSLLFAPLRTEEILENRIAHLFRDAYSVIFYREANDIRTVPHRERHRSSLLRILECIGYQVRENDFEFLGIKVEHNLRLRTAERVNYLFLSAQPAVIIRQLITETHYIFTLYA